MRLKLFSEGIESLKRHERLFAGDRPLTLKGVRQGGGGAIARFADVGDRAAAESLRGQLLTVPRSELPPLDEGEYYHADLLGLPCLARDGEALGSVIAVENYGAGDIIEIEKADGKKAMVPFRPGIADLVDGKIVVDPLFLA